MVDNSQIVHILYQISEYLAMEDIPFKPRAYEKAARAIDALEEPIEQIYKNSGLKGLEQIPGVGISIAEKIEELIKTGHLKYYEQLKKKIPVDVEALTAIEGIGPKAILTLYKKLSVKGVVDLEKVAREGKISKLPHFGKKSEEKILKAIELHSKRGGRFSLGEALPLAERIKDRLTKLENIERVEIAGSIRRRRETIGDCDILAVSAKPEAIMDYFVTMPEVIHVYGKGKTKTMVRLRNGMDVDLRVVPHKSFGAALNYFTGNKDHNVKLRQIAIKKGLKLSEYGLFGNQKSKIMDSTSLTMISSSLSRGEWIKNKNDKSKLKNDLWIGGRTEEELYKILGLIYIEPELRENNGEIEAAAAGKLPKLIGYDDLLGDLQVQSNWTDGQNSIEELTKAAIKLGRKYIAITDHTKRLAMTRGLDGKRILKQMAEIDKLNKKLHNIKILKGTECDILKDGSLDLPDAILAKLDVVGVSIHSYFNMPQEEMTKRIIRAISNPHVDILFHPTGRLINKRDPYQVDMEEIIKVAKRTGTILEINAHPERLDLKDEYIRKAKKAGIKFSINSDAHSINELRYLHYGIAQARRGWTERKNVINAWPLEKMLKMLK